MLAASHQPEEDRWKERFRAPSIWSASIAQQRPERGLVWADPGGTLQFHAWDVTSGSLRELTHTPGGHSTFLNLSPDGEWVYYLKDEQGNETGHFVRMPYAGGEPVDITPDMPPYSVIGFAFASDGSSLGFTTAGPGGFDTFLVEIHPDGSLGLPRPIAHFDTICDGPLLSADGRITLMMSSEHSGKNEFALVAIYSASGARIAELWDGEGTSLGFRRFSLLSGDPRILAQTNRSGNERLLLWNPLTGERQDLPIDLPGAHYATDWSADGERILVQAVDQAEVLLGLYHLPQNRLVRLNPPPGEYWSFFARGGSAVFAIWSDAGHNNRIVELDPKDGHLLGTPLLLGEAPTGHTPRSIHFSSSDGMQIQGWLCLPDGSGPFPTILETHGGPAGVKFGNSFDPTAQAWVDHGFAFLSINYHGSVTFGREFEQKIWLDLGHWEVEDLNAAHAWLVREGIARPEAVFLTGWSYGGYLTLMGLGKNPELWAGGMAGVAISDWAVMWEDTADALRGYQEALLGGTPQQQPERYRASSPVTYAEAVRAPLLIVQGANDTRTPARPIRQYEEKMRGLGKEIEVIWFDSGHIGAFADKELGIGLLGKMIHFAQDVLKRSSGA